MEVADYITPYRPGARYAGNVPHGFSRKVSNPYPDGIVLGKANTPIIPHILARTGFDSAEKRCRKRRFKTKSAAAGLLICQYTGNHIDSILAKGAEKADKITSKKVKEMKKIIGF